MTTLTSKIPSYPKEQDQLSYSPLLSDDFERLSNLLSLFATWTVYFCGLGSTLRQCFLQCSWHWGSGLKAEWHCFDTNYMDNAKLNSKQVPSSMIRISDKPVLCSCVATSRTNAFLHSIFCIRAVKKGRQQAKLGHETTWNNQVIAQAWDNFAAIHLFVNWLLHVVVLWWVLRDKQVRRSWGMQLIFYPCGYHGATDGFCSLYAQSSGAGRGGSGSGLERFTFSCGNCYRLCVETIWPRLYLYAPAGATLRCNLFVLGSACAFSFEKTVEEWLGVNLNLVISCKQAL